LHTQCHELVIVVGEGIGLNSLTLPPIGMYCPNIIKLPDEWEFASPLETLKDLLQTS
jgi:hypothetical protein